MSFKYIDIEGALRRLADRRIEDAISEGKFNNLAGSGRPLELEPVPANEEARMLWWALRILRRNNVVPEEIQWRKMIDPLKAEVPHVREEQTGHARDADQLAGS
jgi:hypothetical protein